MDLRKLLVGLIILATAVFGIAVAFERSNADVHSAGTEPSHSEAAGDEETHTDEGGEAGAPSETAGSGESAESDEGTILGVNPEATPIVVLVVAASLVLAGALWLRPDWIGLLLIAAIGMLVFAILDVREVIHQINESNTGLGIAAFFVTALHAAATLIALLLLRQANAGSVSAS